MIVVRRDVVRVVGPDAASFLQGQLSQDVQGMVPGGGARWSFVLQPQGKVDALVRVTRDAAEEFTLDVDAGFGDPVVARLERFKLRVKADVTLVGAQAFAVDEGAVGFSPVDGEPVGEYDAWRARVGFPAMGRELTESTIPEETGWVDAAVSFTKGCYTGQELVARVDSRGRNVPRRLRRIVAGAGLVEGDELVTTGGDGKVVGRVTTAVGGLGLGYVGRHVEPGAELALARGGVARIEALPPVT